MKQIAEELGVSYVLEGSVRKSDDRVRITAQLNDVATGSHVWAEHYDRNLADVFAVQVEVLAGGGIQGRQARRIRHLDRGAERTVASYHDRMPLALADDKVALWLDLSQESPLDQNLLPDLTEFTVRPMDRAMNNVRQKNLAAIDPEAEAA